MDITGVLKLKKAEEAVSDKFKKREFVLTDNSSQYPQHISFQLTQVRCELINEFEPGDEIRVHFNLRGREWTSPTGEIKYFNSVEAWKIEPAGGSAPRSSGGGEKSSWKEQPSSASFAPETDDLPF